MDIGGVDDRVKFADRSVSMQTLNEQSLLRQNGIMVGMSEQTGAGNIPSSFRSFVLLIIHLSDA